MGGLAVSDGPRKFGDTEVSFVVTPYVDESIQCNNPCGCAGCRTPDRPRPLLPENPSERKGVPLASGVLDYFPSALIEIAKLSKAGNDQHNPGEPLHWARGKSTDQADTIIRHFLERGTIDPVDGIRHSAKLAWRALALLQLELEAAGYPVARGARGA